LLHAHDYKTNVLAVVLGRWFNLPVLTTLHGYVTRGGRLEAYYWIDRWALRRMDHVIAVSDDLYEFALGLGLPASRCSLIENAIDTQQYARSASLVEAKRRLGIDPRRLVIGAVGRMSPEKGFDVLIRSTRKLLDTGLDLQVIIAGDGPERSCLKNLSRELGCADRIDVLGYRTDTSQLYEAMDVFVLSSLREGLPNVLLEAMAMEVPVVATRVAGVPRLIEHGTSGLLVEANDLEGLTRDLGHLLGDGALRTRLANAGRRTVESRHSFAVRIQKVRAVYDAVLMRRRTRAVSAKVLSA
jgi:glycosyltransferase involved in cell wall biosynthesis